MPINTLAPELYKIVLRNFTKRKQMLTLIDNMREVDFIDMPLISKCNNGIRVLLYVVNIHSQHAWVIPLNGEKRKKGQKEISGCTEIST